MSTAANPSERAQRYHHGALKEAMLEAAESILKQEGLAALTLRRAAREAGASHAAPKNHFGDLAGLLSELAAVGFGKFAAVMLTEAAGAASPAERLTGLGRGYIRFARENPAMFLLMFRSDRLDARNAALAQAGRSAFEVLTAAITGRTSQDGPPEFSLAEAARIAESWAKVHGLAMLLIDGRLNGLIAAARTSEEELVAAALAL